MQNFKNYLSQLTLRDRLLLIFSVTLLSFVVIKFFLIDGLNDKNTKLLTKSSLISQQENLIKQLDGNSSNGTTASSSANQLINSFLRENSSSKSLKQIRSTNDGSQRFELEAINFTIFAQLLKKLETNSINYKSLQIKKTKTSGTVDATLTIQ